MPLLAGCGIADISPLTPMFLCGYPHEERTSTGVHDPLLASALLLKNEASATLLIACDILFFDPPTARRFRSMLAEKLGIEEACIFISCTHTHSGPVTIEMISWQKDPIVPRVDPVYMAHIEAQILAAAMAAQADLSPAEIAWTTATATDVGGNRIDPSAPSDREVSILAIRTPGSEHPRAVSMTYGMHPTVLHEDSTLISGDFPFFTREAIQDAFGKDCTVLYHTGPSGNQSPRYSVTAQTFAEAERLGRRLGVPVVEALHALKPESFATEATLAGCIMPLSLPRRTLPTREEAHANFDTCMTTYHRLKQENAPHGPVRTAECATFGAEETVVLAEAQADGSLKKCLDEHYDPMDMQAVRIGEKVLCGFPCELFVEYGLELKDRSAGVAIPVSLVNGETQGYIVTPEAEAAGGYEATNACFTPAAGTMMVDTLLQAVKRMQQA